MEMDEKYPIPSWNAAAHLQFMDEAGIQTAVLTMPAPQPFFGNAARLFESAGCDGQCAAKAR